MNPFLFTILSFLVLVPVYVLNWEVRKRVSSPLTDPSGDNMLFSTIAIFLANVFARSAETDTTRLWIFVGALVLLLIFNMDTIAIFDRRRNG